MLNKREIDDEEARERTKWRNDDLCIDVSALVEKDWENQRAGYILTEQWSETECPGRIIFFSHTHYFKGRM